MQAHGSPEMADLTIKNQRTADEQLEVFRAIVNTFLCEIALLTFQGWSSVVPVGAGYGDVLGPRVR